MTKTQQVGQTPRRLEPKLQQCATHAEQLMVEIHNPAALSDSERHQILENCKYNNLSFYHCAQPISDSHTLKALAEQLGLRNLCDNPKADAHKISHITVSPNSRYIPYTNRALLWHTDGYYNIDSDTIRSFMMHCVQPAIKGGINDYLDHEVVYTLLHQKKPDYVEALSHPQAFTVPANEYVRDARSSPVFRNDLITNKLLMHYTERSQHIEWHPSCKEALDCLRKLIHTTQYKLSYKLAADEGVICNNVLHNRSAFEDSSMPKRLLYRARFRDRVGN